jgi:hypothetical protein
MKRFQTLGREIEDTWRDANYDEEKLPAIAAEALRRAELPAKITAWEVIEWALAQNELPPQKDPHGIFGDPPITIFVAPRFYIDVYFWLEGTTAVHQHSFCGAFQVLMGSSIHSWYEFERKAAVNSFMETGSMSLKLCELLRVGDVQEIRAGRQYIHSLFHLDQPSATIVVRTEKSPLYLPQFSYHKPSLAIDPFFEHQTTAKKLQSISALFRANHPETDRFVNELLEASDFQTSVSILTTLHGFLSGSHLDQLFNLSRSASRFESFLSIVVRRHGAIAETLPQVFAHRERVNDITRRRGYVTDPEHRFFLALLMNVDGRDRIFSLIKQRFPDADPLDKVLDWSFELAQTRVIGVNIPNALGIADFNEIDLFFLENLLKGRTDDETREAFSTDYGAERAAATDIDGKLAKIRESVIFEPLLSD